VKQTEKTHTCLININIYPFICTENG